MSKSAEFHQIHEMPDRPNLIPGTREYATELAARTHQARTELALTKDEFKQQLIAQAQLTRLMKCQQERNRTIV